MLVHFILSYSIDGSFTAPILNTMAISPNRPQPCYCHELQNPPIRSGSRPSPLENNNKKDSLTSHKHSLSSSSSNKTQSFQTSSSASTKETFRNLTREILNSELFLRSDSKIVQSEEAEPVKFNPMSVTSLETSLEVPIILSEEYVFVNLVYIDDPRLTGE